jgi:hypothetical protein
MPSRRIAAYALIAELLFSGLLIHLFATPVRHAQAITGCNSPFAFTGGEQTCIIPFDVVSMTITAIGGAGAQGGGGGGDGGAADEVVATFPVGPGTAYTVGRLLYVEVGGNGALGSGVFNGGGAGGPAAAPGGNPGGGGGGGSGLRTCSISSCAVTTLDSRFIVAGAGGGGGGRSLGNGGAGGDAINSATPALPGSGSPGFPPPPATMPGAPGGGGGSWGGSGFPGGLGGTGGDGTSLHALREYLLDVTARSDKAAREGRQEWA